MSLSLVGQKINQYLITKQIGSSMIVYVGVNEVDKKEVVVKVMNSKKKAMNTEIKVGIELSQKCIFLVRYEELIIKANQSFIIMEYCSKGDLAEIIDNCEKSEKVFTDEEIFQFVLQVGNAVQVLHSADIIHRDLKPDNIFLTTDGIFKVGDFGISRSIDPSRNKTTLIMASVGYACPELLDGDENLSKAIDIYSLGCIILQLIDMRHPFSNERGVVQQSRVLGGKANIPRRILSVETSALRTFALRMVNVDAAQRPPIEALLSHPSVIAYCTAQYISGLLKDKEIDRLKKQLSAYAFTLSSSSSFLSSPSPSSFYSSSSSSIPSLSSAAATPAIPASSTYTSAPISQAESSPPPTPKSATTLLLRHHQPQTPPAPSSSTAPALEEDFPIVFAPQKAVGKVSYSGNRIIFDRYGCFTVGIEKDLEPLNIYSLEVVSKGNINIGLALKSVLPSLYLHYPESVNGTCSICCQEIFCGKERVVKDCLYANSPGQVVQAELNQSKHTLHFFVNGGLIAHCIVRIPLDVYFMVSSSCGYSVEVRSLKRVLTSTMSIPSSIVCKEHQWR